MTTAQYSQAQAIARRIQVLTESKSTISTRIISLFDFTKTQGNMEFLEGEILEIVETAEKAIQTQIEILEHQFNSI